MSSSSIYGIRKDYTGEEIFEYKNSWWFSPIIWSVLPDKYIHDYIQTPFGFKKGIIGMDGNDVWTRTNKSINECDNTPDRVCWEMSNQQIFHTSDKQIISESIMQFLKQNDTYDISEEDNIPVLKREHIIERFTEIANDILSINENEFPYFVFKNTTVGDGVERWFEKYDEESDEYVSCAMSKNTDDFYAEFVFFKDGKINKFVSNKDYQFES